MDADVVIVGAGPAGSTCARLLADKGRSVLLLDRSTFPRKKPCGGWINLKAFQEFPELEKLRTHAAGRNRLVEAPLHGLVFLSADLQRRAAYMSRRAVGYTVRREQFDARLAHLAARSRSLVRFIQRQHVVAVEPGESGVAVTTQTGKRYEGRILIGADGADSTVARTTGLSDGWPQERTVVCLAGEFSVNPRTLAKLYGKRRAMQVCIGYRQMAGYAWAFPKRSTVSVGVGCRADAAGDLDGLYAQWVSGLRQAALLPEKGGSGRPVRAVVPAGGAIDYEGHVGKRTVLVGDAGGFVSAATGEGIYPAMRSAKVAARCIDRALGSARPQDALLEFKFAWRRAFAEYIQMPNANLGLLLPLIYDNEQLCKRLAECYLFGRNF